MATIKCSKEGCEATYTTEEQLSKDVKFSCRKHTKSNENKARFQSFQFDKDLRRGGTPQGTTHIANQGSHPKPAGICPSRALKEKEDNG